MAKVFVFIYFFLINIHGLYFLSHVIDMSWHLNLAYGSLFKGSDLQLQGQAL